MRLVALLVAVGVGGSLWAPAPVDRPLFSHFMDGPPVRSSGGFGEPSCIDCHWGAELNDPAGAFFLEGLPGAYSPGETYELSLVLTRRGMAVGGFQMAARFAADSTQAGAFELAGSEDGRLGLVTEREVTYVQQRLPGMALAAPDTARWVVRWTAPEGSGEVRFHASGNVGDGDDSQIGDYVYLLDTATVAKH